MGSFGVNMNDFEGKAPGNWLAPDPGRQMFEIVSVTEGVNSTGEHAGERYLSAKCSQITGDDPGTRSTSVYLGLSTKPGKYGVPVEQTKGYLEAWGRQDIIEGGEDSDVNDLIGTTFEADVKVKTAADGNIRVNLTRIEAVSHAQAEATPPPNTKPEPKAAPAPAMRRGR